MRWGKIHAIEAFEDSQEVARGLAVQAAAGVEENRRRTSPELELTLADGTHIEIRPLERGDRAALASAAARLSDRSTYPRLLDTLTELDRHSSDALLARLIERASDEGHPALHATVVAENRASVAMLRHAGLVRRSGPGVQIEFELVVTPIARSTALAARRENP